MVENSNSIVSIILMLVCGCMSNSNDSKNKDVVQKEGSVKDMMTDKRRNIMRSLSL